MRLKRGTYTHGVDDIVQRELSDERVELEEQGQGLADTTYRARVSDGQAQRCQEGGGGLPAAPQTAALTISDDVSCVRLLRGGPGSSLCVGKDSRSGKEGDVEEYGMGRSIRRRWMAGLTDPRVRSTGGTGGNVG